MNGDNMDLIILLLFLRRICIDDIDSGLIVTIVILGYIYY